LVGLSEVVEADAIPVEPAADVKTSYPAENVRPYFKIKRVIDLTVSLFLLLALLPLLFVIAGLVLLDVGSPVFFWQQRLGLRGHNFLLHKFRTLKTSYDWHGLPIPESERLSPIGLFLRKLRLDELPQLLNVVVGDMSLIGPRPLLPHDQPPDPSIRLSVRPGITGWAQVNGGKLLNVDEKNRLDEWYVKNASFWLDMKIIAKTILFLFQGERRYKNEQAGRLHPTEK
jgi:lipopolysaccharide/colanic/teichoic acid biosynthesis glycosyltransferase